MTLLMALNFDESSGPIIDHSGNNRGWTMTGSSVRTAPGLGHTDRGLTQTTSATDPGPPVGFALTPNRTFMAWIRSTAEASDGRIFEHIDSTGESVWELLLRSGVWHIQAWNAGGFARATITRPSDGLWHHIAGTYDGTNLRCYLDGSLAATTALVGPLRSSAVTLNMLRSLGGSQHILDDFRVYDEARTLSQIQVDMNTPVVPPSTGPIPKIWNGSSWVNTPKPKVYNGSAWTNP